MHYAIQVSEPFIALFRSYHGGFAWRTEKDEQLIASCTEYCLQPAGIWRGKQIGVAIGSSIPCLSHEWVLNADYFHFQAYTFICNVLNLQKKGTK